MGYTALAGTEPTRGHPRGPGPRGPGVAQAKSSGPALHVQHGPSVPVTRAVRYPLEAGEPDVAGEPATRFS